MRTTASRGNCDDPDDERRAGLVLGEVDDLALQEVISAQRRFGLDGHVGTIGFP
jgi:hypothetical protein